ncbi:MAG: PAS domain-containing sensor histidine kinase [Thermoleophilia bacterium]
MRPGTSGVLLTLGRLQAALLKDLEPRAILRNFLEAATEEGIERAALFLFHPATRELVGEVASGRGQHYTVSSIALPVYTQGPIQEAFFAEGPVKRGEEWLIPVAQGIFCWSDPERRCTERPRADRGSRALICPSCKHFSALGVLSLEGVPQGLVPALPLVAQLTALALRNAELFAQREEALSRLSLHAEALSSVNEIARQIAGNLDVNQILSNLALALHRHFGFYRVTVALVQGGFIQGHITVKAGRVLWTEGRSRIHFPVQTSPDPFARAVRERRVLVLPNQAQAGGMAFVPVSAYVPIQDEEGVLGVIAVDHGEGGRGIRSDELKYVELLARMAGVALRNAQAYRERTELSLALAAERRRLAGILEEMPDGVVVLLGEEGFANRRAREALSLEAGFREADLPSILLPALEGGRFELNLNGRSYSLRGGPLGAAAEGEEPAKMLVLHDITERTWMEARLKEQVAFTSALVGMAQAALGGGGLEEVARGLGGWLLRIFRAETVVVGAWADGLRVLWANRPILDSPGPTLIQKALNERKVLALQEVAPEDCTLAGALGVRSALALPLVAGAFQGGILLGYTQPRAFSQRVLSRVPQVQNLAALALEKAHLFQEHQANEARLKALFAHSQDVVYVLDEQGYIRWVSESARAVLGYDPEGSQRARVRALDYVHPEDRTLAEELWRRLIASNETVTATFRVLKADGTPVPFEAWGRNLLAEPRVGGVVVDLRDITARLEAERVKSEFIAAVSHEFRTPLAVIMGLAELLKEDVDEKAKESVELILESAFRLKNMVDNLLDASRLEAGRFEVVRRPVLLTPFLSGLVRSFQGVARLSEVAFRAELADLPPAELDPERVVQVLGNLLTNAFKFTPAGGTVWLRARAKEGVLVLEVQDTGPGISKEEIPRIFERYHRAQGQASRGVPGTGLGLYISRHIVEAHGGRIEVESEEGQGSLFRVILPLYGPGFGH